MFSQNKIKLDEKQEKLFIENIYNEIKTLIKNKGIRVVDVTWRLKSIDSIQNKMKYDKVSSIEKIYDIRGIRIICNNYSDCYNVLNTIHKKWTHIPSKFDDYIKNPKESGYSSLQTVIYYKEKPVEIQITTNELYKKNEEEHEHYKRIKYNKIIKNNQNTKIIYKIFNFFSKKFFSENNN